METMERREGYEFEGTISEILERIQDTLAYSKNDTCKIEVSERARWNEASEKTVCHSITVPYFEALPGYKKREPLST